MVVRVGWWGVGVVAVSFEKQFREKVKLITVLAVPFYDVFRALQLSPIVT